MSVRELVASMQRECLGDLTPSRAAELQTHLAALGGNCAAEIRAREMAYNLVLNTYIESHKASAARATIWAKTTEEYRAWREAKDTFDLVDQLVISLRAFLRTMQAEMKMAG